MTKTEPNTARKPRGAARSRGLKTANDAGASDDCASARTDDDIAAAPHRMTKTSIVLALLRREQGALLADIVAATGWQPHTARAALTGLKKKGHTITSTKVDKVTCYKLA